MQVHKFKSQNGVQVIYTRDREDRAKVGIHLADPSERDFEQAEERAVSQGFPAIYIHLVDVAGVA